MLSSNVITLETLGLSLSEVHHLRGLECEELEHPWEAIGLLLKCLYVH